MGQLGALNSSSKNPPYVNVPQFLYTYFQHKFLSINTNFFEKYQMLNKLEPLSLKISKYADLSVYMLAPKHVLQIYHYKNTYVSLNYLWGYA